MKGNVGLLYWYLLILRSNTVLEILGIYYFFTNLIMDQTISPATVLIIPKIIKVMTKDEISGYHDII